MLSRPGWTGTPTPYFPLGGAASVPSSDDGLAGQAPVGSLAADKFENLLRRTIIPIGITDHTSTSVVQKRRQRPEKNICVRSF